MGRQYRAGDNIEIINYSLGICPRKNCIFLKYIDMDDRCLVLDKETPDDIKCWVILLKDIRMGSAQTNTFSDTERLAAKNISMLYHDEGISARFHVPYCDQYVISEIINSGLHSMKEIKEVIKEIEKNKYKIRLSPYVIHKKKKVGY